VTRPLRAPLAIAATVVLLGSLLEPVAAAAQAQGRTAVPRPRVVPRQSVVVRTYYYRPLFYDPWYPGGFGFGYRSYRSYPTIVFGQRYPYYDGYGAGTLRLKTRPRDAEVFIDGYYAGTVDDFDGIFQRLYAPPGEHDLQIYLPGYRSVRQSIYLQPGRTSTLELTMEPLGPGEPQPIRPDAGTVPPGDDAGDAIGPTRRPAGERPRNGRGARDAAAAAPVESEGAYGTLALRVQPGEATVLIDGETWEGPGLEERLVLEMAAGRHAIEIRKDGYRGYATEVTIRQGETSTLNVALAPR